MTSRPVKSLAASNETATSWCILPSRSHHQDESGLPMISLMLSSNSSPSIGRRNGRINSKLIAEPHSDGSPAGSQAPESEEERASGGHFLVRSIALFAIFRRGLFCPVKLQDRVDLDLPN